MSAAVSSSALGEFPVRKTGTWGGERRAGAEKGKKSMLEGPGSQSQNFSTNLSEDEGDDEQEGGVVSHTVSRTLSRRDLESSFLEDGPAMPRIRGLVPQVSDIDLLDKLLNEDEVERRRRVRKVRRARDKTERGREGQMMVLAESDIKKQFIKQIHSDPL
eukprot:TRINITY_DN1635_c0_g1_i2.p1 TRINITY_DN1635_c0_g1~~TRINITY_DN1635_c0_g1_i2.p1  ORF type:complete len:160 (+),score=52.13 TRINITY_DN1635_c0_g1_i2:787-1266(+)